MWGFFPPTILQRKAELVRTTILVFDEGVHGEAGLQFYIGGVFFTLQTTHYLGQHFSPRTSTVFPYTPKSPNNSSFPPNGTGILLSPYTQNRG